MVDDEQTELITAGSVVTVSVTLTRTSLEDDANFLQTGTVETLTVQQQVHDNIYIRDYYWICQVLAHVCVHVCGVTGRWCDGGPLFGGGRGGGGGRQGEAEL